MTRTTDRLCAAVALAMALAAACFWPLTVDRGYLVATTVVVFGLELLSLVLRRANLPGWAVHLAQLGLLLLVALALGWFSQPEATRGITQYGALFHDAVMQVRTQVAPLSASPGVRWLLVLLVGVVTLLADLLVLTLLSPSWILAPLLTLYLIPALALDRTVPWPLFALLGVGYLAVLAADGINQNATWTRNLSGDSAFKGHSSLGALRLAGLVAVPAMVLTLLAGMLVPATSALDIQSARPRGQGPLQLSDPTIDISKNLNLPVDRVVLTYRADEPLYLRTASLTVMDAKGWHLAPVQLEEGPLPAPPGLDIPGKQVTAQVSVRDLGGEYLPAAYAPQSFTADGSWRFDPQTLTIISTKEEGRTDAIRNLEYQVTQSLNDPQAANFTLAQPGTPPDAKLTAAVPKDVPDAIIKLTHEVTRQASTPVLKAAAIQAYLAHPSNFTYSTVAPPGDGFDVLTNFLTRDKAGYCIHFASAMALMARLEGIPSRVSVGFLPGEKVGDHYEVKASNMHAWPELYFQQYGWVRFEPTSRIASAPEWSLVNKDVKPLPSATASGGARKVSPSPRPTGSRSATPSASASASTAPEAGDTEVDWSRLLGALATAVGVALLLGAPALVRLATRRRRLGALGADHEGVARAWWEVRDTVRDLGHAWPSGTPREIAAGVAPLLGERGRDAMDDLAIAVERSRYARDLGQVGDLGHDVTQVRRELWEQATGGQRTAAVLLPRSLWHRLGDRLAGRREALVEQPPSRDDGEAHEVRGEGISDRREGATRAPRPARERGQRTSPRAGSGDEDSSDPDEY